MSIEKIKQAFISINVSIFKNKDSGNLYGTPSSIKTDTKTIYVAMQLKSSDVP